MPWRILAANMQTPTTVTTGISIANTAIRLTTIMAMPGLNTAAPPMARMGVHIASTDPACTTPGVTVGRPMVIRRIALMGARVAAMAIPCIANSTITQSN